MLIWATLAIAQRGDFYFAMGTARDDANEFLQEYCKIAYCKGDPAMDGLFGTVGGGFMFNGGSTLGVGAEVSFRFAQGDYVGDYGIRPVFYSFNGIYTPVLGSGRVMAELQGGIGGVNLRFYGGEGYYDYYTGQYTNYAGSSNHFQLHAAAGLRFYLTDNVFIRPQLDYRYVPNLDQEFKSNSVLQYTIAIGFSSSP
jgi:hypothetical protein